MVSCVANFYRCLQTQNDSSCRHVLLQQYYANNTLNKVELQAIRLSLELARDRPCQSFFEVILCFFEFPPCSVNTSELLPICTIKCQEIQAARNHCFQEHKLDIKDPNRDPVLQDIYLFVDNFSCSVPETYYFSEEGLHAISNTSCSKLVYGYSLFILVSIILHIKIIPNLFNSHYS